ncbi:unnamed protein product [Echinostoma caproni]|uniref:DUF1330 domain-containing protein n=1 Tax=Echinostoma caproni TaxID=27848 RepID=A0A183A304_9TREM|nr:unnamed protein product [Echinostoma caproni]
MDRPTERVGGGVLLMGADHHKQRQGIKIATLKVKGGEATVKFGNGETILVELYRSPNAETWEDDQLLAFPEEVTAKGRKLLILEEFNAPKKG